MKKVLVLTMVLMLALTMAFAVTSWAGPLIGLQLTPVVGATAGFLGGWDFGDLQLEVVKANFASWTGRWTIGCIWTPEGNGFNYRAGVNLILDWTGAVVYRGVGLVAGVSKDLDMFEGYAELTITSTGVITPVVGLNLFFDRLGDRGDGEDEDEGA